MTSNWSGRPASCMHVLSTIISSALIMGYCFATSRNSCARRSAVNDLNCGRCRGSNQTLHFRAVTFASLFAAQHVR